MISNFVEDYNGFLSLTDEELQRAQQSDPAFPHSARENLKTAVKFAEFKYTR